MIIKPRKCAGKGEEMRAEVLRRPQILLESSAAISRMKTMDLANPTDSSKTDGTDLDYGQEKKEKSNSN